MLLFHILLLWVKTIYITVYISFIQYKTLDHFNLNTTEYLVVFYMNTAYFT